MLALLVNFLIFCVVIYIGYLGLDFLIERMKPPPRIAQMIYAICGLVVFILLLELLGVYRTGWNLPRFR